MGEGGLLPASTQGGAGGAAGGRPRRGALWSRCFLSAGQGGGLPGGGGAAGAERVGVAGAFASVHGSSLLLVQLLLEQQGQPAVLLLLPAPLLLLRRRRRGAGMKTRSFGTHRLGVLRAPPSGGGASSFSARGQLVHHRRRQEGRGEVWTPCSTTMEAQLRGGAQRDHVLLTEDRPESGSAAST